MAIPGTAERVTFFGGAGRAARESRTLRRVTARPGRRDASTGVMNARTSAAAVGTAGSALSATTWWLLASRCGR